MLSPGTSEHQPAQREDISPAILVGGGPDMMDHTLPFHAHTSEESLIVNKRVVSVYLPTILGGGGAKLYLSPM